MPESTGNLSPRVRYPMEVATRPATKFASAGLSRLNVVLEVCVRKIISEYASLVRKSYSDVSRQDSTLVLANRIIEDSQKLGSMESSSGTHFRLRRQPDDNNDR